MPTIPRYPSEGVPRCPVCDAPYQTCVYHTSERVRDGADSTDPQYLIDVKVPRRVRAPDRLRAYRGPIIQSQALIGPPLQKG